MNRDVILADGNYDIYPLSHRDSRNEIFIDTYFRKEINEYPLLQEKAGQSSWVEQQNEMGDTYYVYTILPEDYAAEDDSEGTMQNSVRRVKESDQPLWDIRVDPRDWTDSEGVKHTNLIKHKTQVKYRAWCTTVICHNGSIEIISLKPIPIDEPGKVVLVTIGLRTRKSDGNWHKDQ